MNLKHVYSDNPNTKRAVEELKSQLKDFKVKFLLFFTTIQHNPETLNKELYDNFKDAELVGCTSVGTMTSGKMFERGLVAVAFSEDALDKVKIEIVKNVKDNTVEKVKKAFDSFEEFYGVKASQMSHKEYVGMILTNALLNVEEEIMETIGSQTNVFFVGGSAADEMKFETNFVYANNEYYEDSSVLILLKPNIDFEIVKTQSFHATEKKMMVTKANADSREVMELDGKPILEKYSEILNVPVEEVSEHFFMNPLGIVTDDDIYIRSPFQITENKSLLFACGVLEGIEVCALKNGDIIGDMKKILEKYEKEQTTISGIISFNCVYRLMELQAKNLTEEYANLYKDIPTTGMNGYGEDYLGHVNQTATMIVFK